MKLAIVIISLAVLPLLSCGSSSSCVAEGQAVGAKLLDAPTNCCAGLVAVAESTPMDGGCAQAPPNMILCTRCGDGQCGLGENRCNCFVDCDANCAAQLKQANAELETAKAQAAWDWRSWRWRGWPWRW